MPAAQDITVPRGSVSASGVQLTAGNLQRIRFEAGARSIQVVVTEADAPVYWSPSGLDIEVGASFAFYIPAVTPVIDERPASRMRDGATVVALITEGTATVTIQVGA